MKYFTESEYKGKVKTEIDAILGVHVRYARYFRIYWGEYSVEPMNLFVETKDSKLQLEGNGYNYYGEKVYWLSIKSEAL